MKIRTGFISNSSSSSFICVGINISSIEDELFEKLGLTGNFEDVEYDEKYETICNELNKLCNTTSFDWIYGGNDEIFITTYYKSTSSYTSIDIEELVASLKIGNDYISTIDSNLKFETILINNKNY